jgi:hypothetical protein
MNYLNNYKTFLYESNSISDSSEKLQESISEDIISVLGKYTSLRKSTSEIYNLNEMDFKFCIFFNFIIKRKVQSLDHHLGQLG